MRKGLLVVGLNQWLPIWSLAHSALSHQATWKVSPSHSVRFLDSWTNLLTIFFVWVGGSHPDPHIHGFPHGFQPWTCEGLPIFCCTGHFTTPSSIKKFYQFWAWTPGFQSPAQNLIHWVTKPCTGKVSQTQPLSWILGLKHFSMPWLFHER